ncbi:MAG TPA: hypothetical protein ENJ83_01925 [Rhodospirillales bacterium]|nr:hypothetical protein [Rhodospirillales bacterium]
MPRITFATVLKLLIASFLVGLVLALFDVTPREVLAWARGLLRELASDFWGWVNWALSYVLIGAVVVVPIWAISYLFKALRRRS